MGMEGTQSRSGAMPRACGGAWRLAPRTPPSLRIRAPLRFAQGQAAGPPARLIVGQAGADDGVASSLLGRQLTQRALQAAQHLVGGHQTRVHVILGPGRVCIRRKVDCADERCRAAGGGRRALVQLAFGRSAISQPHGNSPEANTAGHASCDCGGARSIPAQIAVATHWLALLHSTCGSLLCLRREARTVAVLEQLAHCRLQTTHAAGNSAQLHRVQGVLKPAIKLS